MSNLVCEKFAIQKTFCITFEINCTTKIFSNQQMTKHYDILKKENWYQPDLAKPKAPLPKYEALRQA